MMKRPPSFLEGLYLAWLLGWKDCVTRFSSLIAVVFVFAVPLVMVSLTGLAFQGFESRTVDLTVAIEDNDHGDVARRLRDLAQNWTETPAEAAGSAGVPPGPRPHFSTEPLDPEEARRRVRDRELAGLIVLPEGLSRRLAAGEEAKIDLLVGPKATLERSAVEATVDRLVCRVREQNPRPLHWEAVPEGSDPRLVVGFSAFSQAVAGNGVMFILLNCILIGGLAITREKTQNTLDRLMISPMTPRMIFLGKVLGVYMVGLIQAAVIFGFGLLLGVPLGSVLGIVLVTLLFILVACSLALAISAWAKRPEQVQDIGAAVGLLMTALGGGMFPIEMAPAWMQRIALLLPTGWAMQAYHLLMWEGAGWKAVLPHVLVLAGFATVFFTLGSRILSRR
jgi:ABC-2 type transport system permease protein